MPAKLIVLTDETTPKFEAITAVLPIVPFYLYIGSRTKYGKRPGKTSWSHTEKFIKKLGMNPTNATIEEISAMWSEIGVEDESTAAMTAAISAHKG